MSQFVDLPLTNRNAWPPGSISCWCGKGERYYVPHYATIRFKPRLCRYAPYVWTKVNDGLHNAGCGRQWILKWHKGIMIRRSLLKLLFVEGNHFSLVWKSANCELQALAYRFRMMVPRFPYQFPSKSWRFPSQNNQGTNRCILANDV